MRSDRPDAGAGVTRDRPARVECALRPERHGLAATAAGGGWGRANSAALIAGGGLLTVALHLAFSGIYGYQRDELYFIACAQHLAWGYVDQPPAIALVTSLSLHLFGDGLVSLRIFPALAAGTLVALSGYVTQRLGGGTFAATIAMLGVALAPFDLAVGNLLTMNAFEPLLWFTLTLLAYTQIDAPRRWRWAAIGAVVGIGMLTKWSIAIYAFSLLIGLLLSSARRTFAVPGLAFAVLVAASLAAPNLAWQATHGWPQIEVLHNAELTKNESVSPLVFLLEQLPLMNPFSAPLWIAGLSVLVRSRRYAGIAIAYGVFLALELLLHGKVYYVAPIYPPLIAVGAVAFERLPQTRPYRFALAGAIVFAGLALMPLAMPTLPLPVLLNYQHALDVRTLKMENHPIGLVPQQFADQLGWNDLETTIARVIATLTPTERAAAAVLTGDYGQAAAIDFFGHRDRLPPAISGHNQYYVWGPRGEHAIIVAIGVPRALLAREYRSVERVATYTSPFILPQNSNLPVYVCRRPRVPLEQFWPRLRRYV